MSPSIAKIKPLNIVAQKLLFIIFCFIEQQNPIKPIKTKPRLASDFINNELSKTKKKSPIKTQIINNITKTC